MEQDRFRDPYDLSQADIDWFRSCRSVWVETESGAPAIFGPGLNPDVIGTVSAEVYETFEERMEPIQCAFFLHATLHAGRYALAADGARGAREVDVAEDDLLLFRHTSWRAFTIDPKRPYGERNNYPVEMAMALGLPVFQDAEGRSGIASDLERRLVATHRKMQDVLQAYIEHADLAPGRWLIPFEGWDAIPSPRCRPVGAAAIVRYKAEMASITARERDRSLISERIRASVALFGSP